MSMVVSLNKLDEAMDLLEGGHNSNVFGKIVLYNPDDLTKWGDNLKIEKILSARTFYGLQSQETNRPQGVLFCQKLSEKFTI